MSTAELIATVMAAGPDRQAAIVAAARGADSKPRPGTVREAADILRCCGKTVFRYVDRDLLHPIRITPRRVRFDLNEVEALATRGARPVATE